MNDNAFKLSGDIETNPGPFVVDPSKTICAPYSQGNDLVFGSNAGKKICGNELNSTIIGLHQFNKIILRSGRNNECW